MPVDATVIEPLVNVTVSKISYRSFNLKIPPLTVTDALLSITVPVVESA